MKAYWTSESEIIIKNIDQDIKALYFDDDGVLHDLKWKIENDEIKIKTPVKLSFRTRQTIAFNNYQKVIPSYKYIVKTEWFDKNFSYTNDDLGCDYSKDKTTFKVWAPTVRNVYVKIEDHLHKMKWSNNVWSVTVDGDLEKKEYTYLVEHQTDWQEATDPYALSVSTNSVKSVVIDKNKIEDIEPHDLCIELNDPVIYEMSVRDFTYSSTQVKNKSKFIGLTEEVEEGFNHLKKLGINVVQLMPIYDFASVNDEDQFKLYNWGYDPLEYNIPEGSYATSTKDPYKRINECITMVKHFHKHNFKVVMDVVYNHMFSDQESSFEKLVPRYFFRYRGDDKSNGSFCGNDFESNSTMGRKFIVDSCLRWVKMYGINGFRFDLMGIIDIKTKNEIVTKIKKVCPGFMFYGEGWNMPTLLEDKDKSAIINQEKIIDLAFFNDRFRDVTKGIAIDSKKLNNIEETNDIADMLVNLFTGTVLNSGDVKPYIKNAKQTINYVECHDDETLFDFIKEHKADNIKQLHSFATTFTLISRGIPFIHSGQEYFRSKMGVKNTYMSPDKYNHYDWEELKKNGDYVDYISKLIKFRSEFILNTDFDYEKINKNVLHLFDDKHEIIINASDKDIENNFKGKVLLNSWTLSNEDTKVVKGKSILITEK